MDEARQPDSTHSMLRGDSSIQLSFSRVQSPRTYLVPSWHQTPNISLGKSASAAAAVVVNAARPATVFKRRFTGTSPNAKRQPLDSESPPVAVAAARAVVAAASDKAVASALPSAFRRRYTKGGSALRNAAGARYQDTFLGTYRMFKAGMRMLALAALLVGS